MASDRTGWRLREGQPPEPPSTLELLELLIEREESGAPIQEQPRGWLRVTVKQFIIIVDRFAPPAVARWSRSFSIKHSLVEPGADVRSLAWEQPRLRSSREGTMSKESLERSRAELKALQELSEEKMTPQQRRISLEKRKREFDEAWEIDPNSSTDHSPLRVVK